jgi:hypothetical protein
MLNDAQFNLLALWDTLREVNPRLAKLLIKIIETHISKSADYAKTGNPFSNFERAAEIAGVDVDTVFRTMLGIKDARLENLLASGKEPNNESLIDTYLDKAVYALLHAAYKIEVTTTE